MLSFICLCCLISQKCQYCLYHIHIHFSETQGSALPAASCHHQFIIDEWCLSDELKNQNAKMGHKNTQMPLMYLCLPKSKLKWESQRKRGRIYCIYVVLSSWTCEEHYLDQYGVARYSRHIFQDHNKQRSGVFGRVDTMHRKTNGYLF